MRKLEFLDPIMTEPYRPGVRDWRERSGDTGNPLARLLWRVGLIWLAAMGIAFGAGAEEAKDMCVLYTPPQTTQACMKEGPCRDINGRTLCPGLVQVPCPKAEPVYGCLRSDGTIYILSISEAEKR